MSFIQNMLDQLSQIPGLEVGNYMDIANLTPEQISSSLAAYHDMTGAAAGDVLPSMFQAISPEMLLGGLGKTYSPAIEQGGTTLLSSLKNLLGGKKAEGAWGGFAGGYGQRQFEQTAKDAYGKDISGIIGKSATQRAQGLQSVQDVINQWQETISEIS